MISSIEDETLDFVNIFGYLTEEQVYQLAEALKSNHSVKRMYICVETMSLKSIGCLAEVFKVHKSLAIVDLAGNHLGPEHARLLCGSLNFVTRLELQHNKLKDEGAKVVAEHLLGNGSALLHLDISSNKVGLAGAVALSGALCSCSTRITSVNFSHNLFGDEGAIAMSQAIKTNTTLTTLQMSACNVTQRGFSALFDALAQNKTLTRIRLYNNAPEMEGTACIVSYLKRCDAVGIVALKHLDISAVSLGCDGAALLGEGLKVNQTLQCVDVAYNMIEAEGSGALGEALKINQSIEKIDLSGNSMCYDGLSKLCDGLKSNQELKKLIIGRNSLSPACGTLLAQLLKCNSRITTLDVHNNPLDHGVVAIFESLHWNRSLKKLVLSDCVASGVPVGALSELLKVNHILAVLYVDEPENEKEKQMVNQVRCLHNGSLIHYSDALGSNDEYCVRNRGMHDRAKSTVVCFQSIRKFRSSPISLVPKEVVSMIARCIWDARVDIGANW